MEKISFSDILWESFRLSFADKKLLLFGFFLAVPIASQFLLPLSSENSLNTEATVQLVSTFPFTTFAVLCFFFFLHILGKGSLIALLSSFIRPTLPKPSVTPSLIWKNTKKTFLLNTVFGIFFILLIFFLSLPSFISFFLFGHIPKTLISLGTGVFLFVALIVFFIHTFSLFYFLLSPLKLFSAIERGYVLLYTYRLSSLLFGLFTFSLCIIFTFCLNLVMLGGVVLFQGIFQDIPQSIVFFIMSLCSLTWFTVFTQALWLNFFIRLATPKDPLPEKAPEAILKESVPETPMG